MIYIYFKRFVFPLLPPCPSRLVCQDTVEDNISRPSLQQKVILDIKRCPENGSASVTKWRINKHTLEDLFGFTFGDNGLTKEKSQVQTAVASYSYCTIL